METVVIGIIKALSYSSAVNKCNVKATGGAAFYLLDRLLFLASQYHSLGDAYGRTT
jgi:hypothetical protein